jgi:hypothetical protein
MGRLDRDDIRTPASSSPPDRDRGGVHRRELAPDIRQLPDQRSPPRPDRNRFEREHSLALPSGPDREPVRDQARTYQVRGSEVNLLERAAPFRSVFTADLERVTGGSHRFREDLRSLERQGLIEERRMTRLRDGTVADVITVTGSGKALLDHHRDLEHDGGQVYYAGWVRIADIWHDASLFRMCHDVESELGREGGRVRRIILDDELQARAYRALHDAREADGPRGDDPHKTIAAVQGLHVEDGRFVFPDVRLEVEDLDGTIRTVDLEMVTEHYGRGHIGGKARAGFRMFSASSTGSGGGTPQDKPVRARLRQ